MYENSTEMQSLWTLSVTGQWHPCSSPWCDSVCSPALRGWVRLFLDLRLKGQAFTASLYHSYGQNRILLCPGYGTPQTSAFCKVWLHLGSAVHDGFNLQYFSKPCVSVTALKATLEKFNPNGFEASKYQTKEENQIWDLKAWKSGLCWSPCWVWCRINVVRAEFHKQKDRKKGLRLIPWKSCLLGSLEIGCVDNKKKVHPMV